MHLGRTLPALAALIAMVACGDSRSYAPALTFDRVDVPVTGKPADAKDYDFLFVAAVPGADESRSIVVGRQGGEFSAWKDDRRFLSNPELEPLMATTSGQEWLVDHVGSDNEFRVPAVVLLPSREGRGSQEVTESANNHWRVHASGLLARSVTLLERGRLMMYEARSESADGAGTSGSLRWEKTLYKEDAWIAAGLAFSPDGNVLYTLLVGRDEGVRVVALDTMTGEQRWVTPLKGNMRPWLDEILVVTKDGAELLLVANNVVARLATGDGKLLASNTAAQRRRGSTADRRSYGFDGRLVWEHAYDRTVHGHPFTSFGRADKGPPRCNYNIWEVRYPTVRRGRSEFDEKKILAKCAAIAVAEREGHQMVVELISRDALRVFVSRAQ